MKRYIEGDSAAFDQLFSRYEQRAYAFFLRRTRSEDRAEDLYQELFLRIHRSRSSYDPARPFAPWFFRIAKRLLIDDVRRAFRSHEISLLEAGPISVEADDPEQQVACAERTELALEQLSAVERRVLVSAKVEGVGYAELARELGKSTDAVKKLASRAIQRLRAGATAEELLWALAERAPRGT
jgi:RNA polymerase sigma-70 factor (ECF subfamily)